MDMKQFISDPFSQPQAPSRSAVDIVIRSIKAQILNHTLCPGVQLPNEFDLCEQFGVSRGSLREAIKIMATIGILELRPGIGTFVASGNNSAFRDSLFFNLVLTSPSPSEIGFLRKIFENDVLKLIIYHYEQNRRERQSMQCQLDKLLQMISTDFDEDLLFEIDIQFHRCMGAACKIPIVESIYHSLIDFIQVSMREAYKSQTPSRVYNSHHAIMEVIRTRDLSKIPSAVDYALAPWFQSPI